MRNINEGGRSLVEMLGAIAIISVITVGAMTGLVFAINLFRIGQTQSEVEEIARGVSELYAWNRNMPENSVMMTTICDNDILSQSCVDNKWSNAFGGDITVEVDSDTFLIIYTNIPELACRQMGCGETNMWTQVTVYQINGITNEQISGDDGRTIQSFEENCPCLSAPNEIRFKPSFL